MYKHILVGGGTFFFFYEPGLQLLIKTMICLIYFMLSGRIFTYIIMKLFLKTHAVKAGLYIYFKN